jgi:Major Facilitator Superfamily/Aminoglycoside-2''-adenylyltransferase
MWPANAIEVQQHQLRILELCHVDLDRSRFGDRNRRNHLDFGNWQPIMKSFRLNQHGWPAWFERRHKDRQLDSFDPECCRHQDGLSIRADGRVAIQKCDVRRSAPKHRRWLLGGDRYLGRRDYVLPGDVIAQDRVRVVEHGLGDGARWTIRPLLITPTRLHVCSTSLRRWLFPAVGLVIAFLISIGAFFRIETRRAAPFVDLSIFDSKTFSGAAFSNFLINGSAGTLVVALGLVQRAAGWSALQSGLLTLGYLVAIVLTIRVGERLLQKFGPKKPMLWGTAITAVGILLTSLTFLLIAQYAVLALIGFTLYGVGLGFYATPSTDAAMSSVAGDKVGAAAGIYKMASSLGSAFGVLMSASDVIELLDALEGRGIDVWLNGGWGVDALLGRQTREHDDLDITISAADRKAYSALMAELGFYVLPGR